MKRKLLIPFLVGLLSFFVVSCSGTTTSTATCESCMVNQATVSLDSSSGGVSNGETDVSLTPLVVLKYSQPMNPQTVSSNTVWLSTSASFESMDHQGDIAISDIIANTGYTEFSFSTESALLPNTTYYITVTDDNKTVNGFSVSGQFSFTTGDFTKPTVGLIAPTNGSNVVGLNPNIQLRFSESVENVNHQTILIHKDSLDGTVIPISTIIAGENNTYIFSMTDSLAPDSTYYIVLTDQITDLAGNHLKETSFYFTTLQADSGTKPEVSLLSPSNNATEVTTTPNIEIKFSEAIVNVDSSTVTLHSGSIDGPLVQIGSIVAGADNTYLFNPQATLLDNTTYYIVLSNGITNSKGNSLNPTSFVFTTGDYTAPDVTILEPLDNATDVELAPTIKIKFSEAVQNINSSTITLRRGSPDEDIVAISQITDEGNNTYSFTPTTPLSPNINYYVVLNNQITDNFGNNLPPTNFRFTTINILGAAYIVSRDNNEITLCDIYPDNSLNNCHATAAINSPSSQAFFNADKSAVYILAAGGNPELDRCDINADKSLGNCNSIGSVPAGTSIMTVNSTATMVYLGSVSPSSVIYACPIVNNLLGMCNSVSAANFIFPLAITLDNTATTAYVSTWGSGFGDGKVQACPVQGDGSFGVCIAAVSATEPSSVVFNSAGDRAYIGQYAGSNLNMCQVSGDSTFNSCNTIGSGFMSATSLAFTMGDGIAYVTDRSANRVSMCEVEIDGTFSNCTYTVTGITQPFWITLNYY
ncbi:Ig-like domain-containing protein [Aquella oligotrophica]|uniref:SbsA Ig-like domain-containing protein n=1 Tax=Aquella oligotrophica TaxID=2067065 RepID=A0A2I7N600_9NEIS|nr:Ig-like domain-containing protein [Aquella oligotrophica]AUR51878.1 hypothetical protein CUN60_06065 [Aquella oligotrophica]